ncbi:efflux RND transporter periplasmic adaptor subunit [Aquamicrobium zhengzhouense]|uniref:Efflux RND transporter periplasmic adaptor subunit n=1 Tax=Aquamicrobium zhengzhouense TaxID=2781738 RepID=A0ABS0SE49_9HYPH|nr:efflux RND transporter periplasmic adaptor subunit [Aquamicrobium zhengzhouense]MBI1621575.1 efflux RND transporter periplasmic adaptor subunit [Aquamicrobium zhengzhouense]
MRSFPLIFLAIALSTFPVSAQDPASSVRRPVFSEVVAPSAANFRSFPGIVRATREVNLAFLAAGSIETRPVSLGDAVEKDTIIATLDERSLRDDAVAARASLRATEAQSAQAMQGYQRVAELNRRGVASTSNLEAARAAMDTAAAAADAARSTVERAEDAELYATLRAPMAGIVTAIQAEPGATVSAGQPIVTLAASEGREAVIDVPLTYLPLFNQNMQFQVSPRIVGGKRIAGTIRLVEPVADRAARMHRVRISLEGNGLRLGSLVDVAVDLGEGRIISVPASAIDRRESAPRVWRVGPDRKLEPVQVEMGPEIEGRIIVTSGLKEGDEILTRGIEAATAGQIVGERISR